jgi:hypothetical protein
MTEQFATTIRFVEEVVGRTQENLQELVRVSQERAQKAGETFKASFEEITDLNRKNLDAVVASGKIAARSVEDASQATIAFVQKSSEASLVALRKLASASNPAEAAEIQQAFARESVAALVAEAERLSAQASTVAHEVLSPIKEQVNATVAVISRPLTA